MDEVDPDFLALPPRLRTRIDRAFDRGLPKIRSSGRKRRKLNREGKAAASSGTYDGEGGFMEGGNDAGGYGGATGGDDGGGFMLDDEDVGGGGFLPEDVEGGFIPDDPDENAGSRAGTSSSPPRSAPTASIPTTSAALRSGKGPLSYIPRLLGLLNLPADEDVLNVFKASAKGWGVGEDDGADRRRLRGRGEDADEKLGVERNDFRAVCAAIMDGAEDGGEDDVMDIDLDEPAEEEDSDSGSGSGDDEDTFEMDEGSELSSLSSDSEYGASRQKTRAAASSAKGKAREISPTPKKTRRKKADLMEQGPLKLVGRQREVARELWDMLKGTTGGKEVVKKPRKGEQSAYVLGREEVKKWVREMGEMWSEDEITDMVSLFSTQHEGRGLSFDDFGQVMLRARVI